MIPEIALPRGARLLTEAAPGARSFAVGFWFPIGSRHEAPNERGFVHFVEHMVFKGSSRRSARDIAREVDRVGGYLNAFTERDCLCFHCTVPASAWRLALDILVDMVFAASFPEEEFERERDVIRSEIIAADDDPEEASHDAFISRIWPGDPVSLKIAGETEDIDAASRAAVYSFYQRRITPSILIASASGPMSGAEIGDELARLVNALPGTEARGEEPSELVPAFSAIRDFKASRTNQVFLYEGIQFEGAFDQRDYYTLSVLNGAVGESMSSRLFQGLREERGLCYSVYSSFALGRKACLWLASASSSARLFPSLFSSLEAELGRLSDSAGSLSEEEISESVSRIAGSFDVALDDPEYRMKRIARQQMYDGSALDEDETRALILAVDKRAVDAMTQRLFSGNDRARFAFGASSSRVRDSLLSSEGKKHG
jgi:predicted Zn-dependent peptidase